MLDPFKLHAISGQFDSYIFSYKYQLLFNILIYLF